MEDAVQYISPKHIELGWGFGTDSLSQVAKEKAAKSILRMITRDKTLHETVRVRTYRSSNKILHNQLLDESEQRYVVEFFSADRRTLSPLGNHRMVLLVWTGEEWSEYILNKTIRRTGVSPRTK